MTRFNAPDNTWSVCRELSGGSEHRFNGDTFEIPDSMNDFEIVEYYDDGFGSESRTVTKVLINNNPDSDNVY